MTPEQNKTIHRAISTFGGRNQTMQTIEELMELQHALFENVHRGTDNRQSIVEEVSDVEIMLAQIKQIYDIKPEEISKVQDYKLGRLNITINKFIAKQAPKNTDQIQIDRNTSNGRV